MKAKLERDLRIRTKFRLNELDIVVRKTVVQTTILPRLLRQEVHFHLPLQMQASRYRIHNYCLMTGRSRSYIRFFRLSRIKLRELALKGALFGIHKSSW